MGPLNLAALVLALAGAAPATADPVDRWSDHIAEASSRFGIPEAWIRRVMRAESGGRATLNGRPIVSHAGAQGLMQLMPGTWRAMRDAYGLGADPHDPRDNIVAGTAYLRLMYDRFGYPGLFAAYNAGPGRYAGHLATGRRLPAETVAYSAAVGGVQPGREPAAREEPRAAAIFVTLAAPRPQEHVAAAPPPASSALFVQLSTASARSE
ncbi:MAG TPA: lytic transglycosylase domain-containing protein [Allosphingosinicella sp.]|nr:lytic transglycosylase domain-containing protein [Allosphingosinicella sp.]